MHPAHKRRNQYGLAVASTVMTGIVAFAADPYLDVSLLPLFLAPVLLSAAFGNGRAALLATSLSILIAAYVFVPPAWSWDIGAQGALQIALFGSSSLAISLLADGSIALWPRRARP